MRPNTEFLIVDDDPSVSEFLATYLYQKGHACCALTEPREAVNWLNQNQCEVVIADLTLPNVDGISLVASVRAVDAKVPIVVFTGNGSDGAQMRAALRAGANGYVSKNLPMEQLYCVLARVLATARYRARRLQQQRELLGAA